MDQRSRITVRLAAEVAAGWLPATVADKDNLAAHATNKLVDALGTVSLVFPATVILQEARQVDALSEWLEISRLRLRLASSTNSEDADLCATIKASHDLLFSQLTQLSATITKIETTTPFLVGTRPDEFNKIYGDAVVAAGSALSPDQLSAPVGLEFRLGLLLLVTDAIPPLSDEQTAKILEWAHAQELLPADGMIGVPIYNPEPTKPESAEPSDKIFIKLPAAFRSQFASLCTALPWGDNECVNQLLVAHASHPLGAQWQVQHEARRTITESLVGECLTLRGLADEAEYCGFKRGIAPSHAAFLKTVLDEALQLEIRVLNLLPVLAGSGWVFAPEFLRALNPLRDLVVHELASEPQITGGAQPMLDYLRLLQILPHPAPTKTTNLL